MYAEFETIVAEFPSWSLRDVRELTVRERRHWAKWAQVRGAK
jgi:hypothetical protein